MGTKLSRGDFSRGLKWELYVHQDLTCGLGGGLNDLKPLGPSGNIAAVNSLAYPR